MKIVWWEYDLKQKSCDNDVRLGVKIISVEVVPPLLPL